MVESSRRVFAIWFCLILLACKDQGPPQYALTLDAVNGEWLLPFTRATGCSTIVDHGEILLRLALTKSDQLSAAGRFGFSYPADRETLGRISLQSGALDMTLYLGPEAYMRLTGIVTSDGHFSGLITDPQPGSSRPVISPPDACKYDVRGVKCISPGFGFCPLS